MKSLYSILALTLVNAKTLPFTQRGLAQLPRSSGVYFAVRRGRILYVGKSSNLLQRWCGSEPHHKHVELRKRHATRLVYLKMHNSLTHGFEAAFIRFLDPECNARFEPFHLPGWCAFLFVTWLPVSLLIMALCVVNYYMRIDFLGPNLDPAAKPIIPMMIHPESSILDPNNNPNAPLESVTNSNAT